MKYFKLSPSTFAPLMILSIVMFSVVMINTSDQMLSSFKSGADVKGASTTLVSSNAYEFKMRNTINGVGFLEVTSEEPASLGTGVLEFVVDYGDLNIKEIKCNPYVRCLHKIYEDKNVVEITFDNVAFGSKFDLLSIEYTNTTFGELRLTENSYISTPYSQNILEPNQKFALGKEVE